MSISLRELLQEEFLQDTSRPRMPDRNYERFSLRCRYQEWDYNNQKPFDDLVELSTEQKRRTFLKSRGWFEVTQNGERVRVRGALKAALDDALVSVAGNWRLKPSSLRVLTVEAER